jgi:hypothetical protein
MMQLDRIMQRIAEASIACAQPRRQPLARGVKRRIGFYFFATSPNWVVS